MAIIIGKVDSGKRLKIEFSERGISDINSLNDISKFRASYPKELEEIQNNSRTELDLEIDKNRRSVEELKNIFDHRVNLESNILKTTIESIEKKLKVSKEKSTSDEFLTRYYNLFMNYILDKRKQWLNKNFDKKIKQRARLEKNLWEAKNKEFKHQIENKEALYTEKWKNKSSYILKKHKSIEDLKYLILGAIGETKVVREIEQLNDSNYLINDFSITFNKPLFHHQTRKTIKNVQVDHILVNNAGIFILETKNWSQSSLENLDLRSPVEQIKRANYAVYSILNEAQLLNSHHWGEKRVPLRNIIVLINNKPRDKFKYVAVKKLSELNRYLQSFDEVLTDNEVKKVVTFLKNRNH